MAYGLIAESSSGEGLIMGGVGAGGADDLRLLVDSGVATLCI
jgi:hypothetical protein